MENEVYNQKGKNSYLNELVALAQGFEGSEMTISNLLKLATSASDLFKSSKPSVKNQILRLLVSNLKIKEKH